MCLSVLSTMYSSSIYMLRDHRAFMSPESCSKVSSAAGKPRHLCDNRDLIIQGRACFLFGLVKNNTSIFHTTVTQVILYHLFIFKY